jgi:hypothetical protein
MYFLVNLKDNKSSNEEKLEIENCFLSVLPLNLTVIPRERFYFVTLDSGDFDV